MNKILKIVDSICSHEALDSVNPIGLECFKEYVTQELALLVQSASMDTAIVNDAFAIEIK